MRFWRQLFWSAALAATALFIAGPAAAQGGAAPNAAIAGNNAATPATRKSADYVKLGGFFNEQQKKQVRRFLAQRYAKGKECPPGMERNEAKRCAPPVLGHYWAVGQPLQPAVEAHPLPPAVEQRRNSARLPPRCVRVSCTRRAPLT